jgi:hypothetical protein
MIHVAPSAAPASLLGPLLRLLRTATLERMVTPDIEGRELDESILLESHLVRTPPLLVAAPRPPLL